MRTLLTGPIASLTKETDGEQFIPASQFSFDVGTWTFTRVAAGDYVMRKTAAANTPKAVICLSDYFMKKIGSDPNYGVYTQDNISKSTNFGTAIGHDIRGIQIKAIDVVYKIATANLNSHAYTLQKTTYANNAANVINSTPGGTLTGALATATQANPYVTPITIGTPYVIGANATDVADWFEIAIDAATTSVYDLIGIFVRYNYNFL